MMLNGYLRASRKTFDAVMDVINVLHFADIDEQALADRINRKVWKELKRTTYHWVPLK